MHPISLKQNENILNHNFLFKTRKNDELNFLLLQYVESKALSATFFNDALHIAIATINNVDYL
jgi:hypothetical protein